MKIFSPILKGTTTMSQGTTNLSGSFTGSLFGTAATASYADNFTVGGTLTAQTINVQIITSSIEFNTGSTRNGALSSNTHQFTGSVSVSGSVGFGGGTPSIFTGYSVASFGSLSTTSNGITIASTTTGNGLIEFADGTTGNQAYRGYLQYAHTADSLSFGTAGSDRMIITSAGSIGIGTTTIASDYKLAVYGTNSLMTFQNANTGQTNGDGFAVGSFGNVDAYLYNYENANMIFGTNATERMRITSGGSVLIGMSSAVSFRSDSHLQVNNCTILRSNDGYNGNPSAVIYSGNDTSGTMFVEFTTSGFSRIGGIYRSGASGVAYNTTSDIRLKKNINNALSSINKINSIQVRSFDWVADDSHQDFGFIAQELINVAPEAVTRGIKEEDIWQVDNSKLVPLLVKAIQELKSENDTLKEILQRNNIQ